MEARLDLVCRVILADGREGFGILEEVYKW